ncbi:MAG: GNAT family N-acetyltransferase [Oscillospiraceae bacterium]|nr:GNAT family N-acetyltransferase [Oscillospiraceae bacterium]
MEIRLLTDEELTRIYREHLVPAFPEAELRPLHAMQDMARQGIYRTYGLTEGTEILGEAFLWDCAPGWKLFDCLCVAPDRRGGGLGAALIKALVEAERGSVIFGESEVPAYAPDPDMARRRLDFYRRNGARQADYMAAVFGVPYHTLYLAEDQVDETAMMAAHRQAYRSRLSERAYQRFIHIPWDPSMGMPEKHPWEE